MSWHAHVAIRKPLAMVSNARRHVEASVSLISLTSCGIKNGKHGASNDELPKSLLRAPPAKQKLPNPRSANKSKAASTRRTKRPPLTAKMPATKLTHQAAYAAMTTKILPATCVLTTPRCRVAQTAASKFASTASTTASFAVAKTCLTDQALLTTSCLWPEFASSNARRQSGTLMTNTCLS